MSPSEPLREFLNYAAGKLEQNLAQIVRCAALLSEDEFWYRPNRHSNSVGNLVLHLSGNVRQWLLAGLGGQSYQRDRAGEFAARGGRPAAQLVAELRQTVLDACGVLGNFDPAALAAPRTIQGYDVSALVAVFHVVEHFSFHTGQIVHAVKAMRDVDLSLYDAHGRRLDASNKGP